MIVSRVDSIINQQNIEIRKIFIFIFTILSIFSDLIVLSLLKKGYHIPISLNYLALVCCSCSFLIIRFLDNCMIFTTKKKRILEIETQLNGYLKTNGSKHTVKIINSRFARHMLLATRFNQFSLLIELTDKK